MKRMLVQRKARLSFQLDRVDYVNPNFYMGLVFYFPLYEHTSSEDAFANMQGGSSHKMHSRDSLQS